MTPRLVPLKVVQAYLGGRHPALLGIDPVARGVWDMKAVDARLDALSGLAVQSRPVPLGAANDDGEDELGTLEERIDAARRV